MRNISFIKHNITNHDNYKGYVYYKKFINFVFDPIDILNKQDLSKKIQDKLIDKVSSLLNNFLNLNLSKRQWKILIGHWIWRYCNIIIHRYDLIDKLEIDENSNLLFYKSNNYDFVTKNTSNIINLSNDDIFNSFVIENIINSSQKFNFRNMFHISNYKKAQIKKKHIIKSFIYKILLLMQPITLFLFRGYNFFFYHTYLKKNYLIKLCLKLNIIPLKYLPNKCIDTDLNIKDRIFLKKILVKDHKFTNIYENIIFNNLFLFFPNIYLENIRDNLLNIKYSSWPHSPKIIFTSNSFDTDEYFKFYLIQKLKLNNTKYIAAQHGNNCGTFTSKSKNIEQETSDFFLTWGWFSNYYKNHIPMFNFREPKFAKNNFNNDNNILDPLFILDGKPNNIEVYDEISHFEKEQNFFFSLIKQQITIFNKIYIKTYSDESFSKEDILSNNVEISSKFHFVNNTRNIRSYKNRFKLFIFTYDSTGFLEMININKPCLMYIRNPLSMYEPNARDLYSNLIHNKIIFTNLNDLLIHYSRHKNSINRWWNSENVQISLKKFKKKFSDTSSNPEKKIYDALNEFIK